MTNQTEFSRQPLKSPTWKAITYDYDELSRASDQARLYCLTDFQVAWLMSNVTYYNWMTRWRNSDAMQVELDSEQAQLEYALMTCLQLQPYQLDYIYQIQITEQLVIFNDLYDVGGIPDLNPDTPTDYFDGDSSASRELALCSAVNIYVKSYASNWVNIAQATLGIVIVFGVLASISIVGGVIATILVGGLALMTQTALNAMSDEDALNDVICCMIEGLRDKAVNQTNFENSLDSCGFTGGSNEAIIRDLIASDLDQWDNYLSFLNSLGDAFVLAEIDVGSCDCELPVTLCWDMTDVTALTINNGSVDSGFGDPLPSLVSEAFDTWKIWNYGEYDFGIDVTIVNAQFDHYNDLTNLWMQSDGYCQKYIMLLNSSDVEITRYEAIDTNGYLSWWNLDSGSVDVSGVRKVRYFAGVSSGSQQPLGEAWIDNFCLEYFI